MLFHTAVYLASFSGFHILVNIDIRECIWKLMSSYLPLSIWFPWDWVEVCSYTKQAIPWRDRHPEVVCLNLRRLGGSSDWVRMCFVGIFGYILKSFGLMSPWDCQLSPRAQEWMVVGLLQSRLWLQLVWLPVKMAFALPGIPIVCPLQPVWGIRKGLLFCIFFSGDFSYMWHVHKVPGPVTSTQEPWGCTVSRVFSQRVLHYHVQDADVWSVP